MTILRVLWPKIISTLKISDELCIEPLPVRLLIWQAWALSYMSMTKAFSIHLPTEAGYVIAPQLMGIIVDCRGVKIQGLVKI